MSWLVLKHSSDLLRKLSDQRLGAIACQYHSKHGVYGSKPLVERQQYKVKSSTVENRIKEGQLHQLVSAYRQHGHRKAQLDILGISPTLPVPELAPNLYGLSEESLQQHTTEGILHGIKDRVMSTKEVVHHLETMYCGTLAAEFEHLSTQEERDWFASEYEQIHQNTICDEKKTSMAKLMLKAQAFDQFLASKFTSVKRYGGEGAESAMIFYDELFRQAAISNVEDVLVCIAHRGRLNLLTCLLKFPPVLMFRKMKGLREFPPDVVGLGDVLSHLTSSVDLQYDAKPLRVTMLPNPSHLEAVNPVAMGKTRARQQSKGRGDYSPEGTQEVTGDGALCFMIHGDASFAGQGVVAETFAMSNVPHFDVGGSVHLIVNNQIGFTTGMDRGRSSQHCSDLGKMVHCPVIHVNGDHPEDVLKASDLAMAYREKFRKDVIVDYCCYRRWGHNEMDEPAFTQPEMYSVIRNRPSIPDLYASKIVECGTCSKQELEASVGEWRNELQENYALLDTYVPKAPHLEAQWEGLVQAPPLITTWDTGVQTDVLQYIGARSVTVPDDMKVHPTLSKTHIQRRLTMMESGRNLDWATAEALALGSLLYQGYNVRICGQDVGRGTFSHRHVMLVDQQTEAIHIPLNHIDNEHRGKIEVCNSLLSEEAVLGFEYGMSIENPRILPIWEAQFGDFYNGAQIIFDTMISGGETKWLLQSGLTVLLPHGMDGAGPEHSSCHIERFLQLTDSSESCVDADSINMQVANPTTPAQYFHLLRRQMVRNFRKPLVVIAPKGMLRHPSCVSSLGDMSSGNTFSPVLGDTEVDRAKVKRVVFVCGKHYYTLDEERKSRGVTDMALVRLESLCPFPAEALRNELNKYNNATDFIWSQEEHRNQGAWSFVAPRFNNIVGQTVRYVGREVSAIPAVGVGQIHLQEKREIVESTFAAL